MLKQDRHHSLPHEEIPDELQPLDGEMLEVLQMLVRAEVARTLDELIEIAENDEESGVAAFLGRFKGQPLPLQHVLDRLRVELEEDEYLRENEISRRCRDHEVGLILPLPPHVTDLFDHSSATILNPNGHHIPPHLRSRRLVVRKGLRECRREIVSMEAIVFEAYRKNGVWYADGDVADLLDDRIVPAETQLIVHRRPHEHHDDVPLSLPSQRLIILGRRRP